MILREQLAEERQAQLAHEAEKAVLEARIDRLTHIVLNSTKAVLAGPPNGDTPCWQSKGKELCDVRPTASSSDILPSPQLTAPSKRDRDIPTIVRDFTQIHGRFDLYSDSMV
jgi:hypothetical protein